MMRSMRMLASSFLVLWCGCGAQGTEGVRPAAVAGQFYPARPERLKLAISEFLKSGVPQAASRPVAIVVPHAGYVYCGQISADAYRQVAGGDYDVVVILGTNHTGRGPGGFSVFPRGAYRTPFGDAPVDEPLAAKLLAQDKACTSNTDAHAGEHSVEVQVPFVQTVLPGVRILPVVLSDPDVAACTRFGQNLAKVLQGRRPLIVASSDLSHYPEYSAAVDADRQFLEKVVRMAPEDIHATAGLLMSRKTPNLVTCACGEAPIMAAVAAAHALGARHGKVLSYANSGDALLGERPRVVGYGAVAFTREEGPPDVRALARPGGASYGALQENDRKALLALAREAIHRLLTTDTLPLVRGLSARLNLPQGAFVTLKKGGELRGCIGHIPAEVPLGQTVGAMAVQAAFNDPRFQPLTAGEYPEIEIEISLLTPMRQVRGPEEIQVGRDGVVLQKDGRSAVFLPQVATENNWGRDEMLDNLCLKAGLRPGSWKEGARFAVFQAEVFKEQ